MRSPRRAARARRSHHHPKPRTEGEALSRLPWRPTNDVSMNEMHTPNSIEHSARQIRDRQAVVRSGVGPTRVLAPQHRESPRPTKRHPPGANEIAGITGQGSASRDARTISRILCRFSASTKIVNKVTAK